MRNNNHNHFRKVGLTGSGPEDKNRFADDFEREAFEGLSKHPEWKRDIPEMKADFRKKWGINRFPLSFRISVYTLATAVCLVFVFIISEKWFTNQDIVGQKFVADNTVAPPPSPENTKNSVTKESPPVQRIVSATDFVEKISEVADKRNLEQSNINKIVLSEAMADDQMNLATTGDVIISDVEEEVVLEDAYFETTVDVTGKKDADKSKAESLDEAPAYLPTTITTTSSSNSMTTKNEITMGGLTSFSSYRKTCPTNVMYDMTVVDYSAVYKTPMGGESIVDNISVASRFEDSEAKKAAENEKDLLEQAAYVPYKEFLNNAMKKFAAKAYADALVDYEVILKQYPGDLNALFYGGLCNYHMNISAKAIQYFDFILIDNTEVFYEETEWYKALALIKADRKDEARIMLTKIINNDGYYKQKASKKLSEIK